MARALFDRNFRSRAPRKRMLSIIGNGRLAPPRTTLLCYLTTISDQTLNRFQTVKLQTVKLGHVVFMVVGSDAVKRYIACRNLNHLSAFRDKLVKLPYYNETNLIVWIFFEAIGPQVYHWRW